jgi:hypothetical protein
MRQLIHVIREIGGVPADERKNGRTERVHPVKAEEVDAPLQAVTPRL